MPLVLIAGPSEEPVSVTEAKTHLRIDGNDEDTVIASLILAARLHIERMLDLALITQRWSLYLDRWPECGQVEIPLGPVQAVDSVTVYSAEHVGTVLDPEFYFVDTASRPARVVRNGNLSWPVPGRAANGIEIGFTAGYGPAARDVPPPVRHAILLLVAHWYEEREPVALGSPVQVPMTIASLVAPFRQVQL